MLDELLQKAVALYVRPGEREAAFLTFRKMVEAARAEGANAAIATLTPLVRREKA